MKPLKRPMFRSGGPIKEGIMHGMQDGGLANNEGPRRAALVGNPVYPKGPDGRTGHVIPAIIGGAVRAAPLILRGLRTATPKASSFFQRIFPSGRFRNVTQSNVAKQGNILTDAQIKAGMIPATQTTRRGLFESLKDPTQLGRAIRENPITAFTAASALPQTAFLAGKGAVAGVKSVPDLLKGYVEAVLPGKQFEDKDPKTTEKDETGLEVVDNFGEQKKGGEAVSQEKKDQITADRIEENRKRYYKLMGIDKMKKGAAYDSLIDASRIIQEQGGDLKGSIKSGTLQSAIINAISKNLDKSTDLKKQIDAAILKGEIEKDIKSADTTKKRLEEAQIKRLERDERENTTTAKISKIFQANKGAITSGETASVLREDGIPYDDEIPDKEFLKYKKNNPGADEVDYFKSIGGGLKDGRYVIGSRLIEKRGSQIKLIV